MTILRSSRRATTWLALAAMVLNAAWPLLANAKPADPALPSEICSASGLNHAAGGAPATPDKGLHASHCTLCPFSAERCAAIPYASQPTLEAAPATTSVVIRGDAPRPAIALYPAAPPRAPPVLS